MAAAERGPDSVVKKRLFEAGYGFNFFKAVHLLEGFAGAKGLGRSLSPADDPVRFRVAPGFCFPASDITAVRNGHPDVAPEVLVNFMGLIGPKGVLPDWYNEHAQQLVLKKDHAFTDFLDMFHHRLLSLFYLAWKKYRLAENYRADGRDGFSMCLADLAGMGAADRERDPLFYRTCRKRLIYFTGMVSRAVPTVAAVEAVIANAVGTPVRVEQFVARMLAVDASERTCLGRRNSTLQQDAMCGARTRDLNTYFIVRLGPMDWEKYLALQPRSRNLALVRKLIAFIVGIEYEFGIELILKGPQIPGLCLGGRMGAPILGRTVLLRHPRRPYPRDVRIKSRV